MADGADLSLIGEMRHEKCRYAMFLDCTTISSDGVETQDIIPGCAWTPPKASPPPVMRNWTGEIEYEDCAECPIYRDAAEVGPRFPHFP